MFLYMWTYCKHTVFRKLLDSVSKPQKSYFGKIFTKYVFLANMYARKLPWKITISLFLVSVFNCCLQINAVASVLIKLLYRQFLIKYVNWIDFLLFPMSAVASYISKIIVVGVRPYVTFYRLSFSSHYE